MLDAVAVARRAPTTCDCGAPVPWGSHFCANCGRPVGSEAVVACEGCGHPLPADASFCASCGRPAEPVAEEPEGEAEQPEPTPTHDETIVHAAAKRSSDPWER
jgi:predicted amidophosphoribosyltransferase